jgi:hypothetical protein
MTTSQTDPFAWWQQWMKQAPSLPLPGFALPTLDLDELDRRIREYRTVEGWLQMNLSSVQMMRQSLEMQRAAVAAWQEMNQNWQKGVETAATAPEPAPSTGGATEAPPSNAAHPPHPSEKSSTESPAAPLPNPFEWMKAWWESAQQGAASAFAAASSSPGGGAAQAPSPAATESGSGDTPPPAGEKEESPEKPSRKKRTKAPRAPQGGAEENRSPGRKG